MAARDRRPDPVETKHWAYHKPVRPDLPTVQQTSWSKNSIDYFVLAKLEKEGLRSFSGGGSHYLDPACQFRFDGPAAFC